MKRLLFGFCFVASLAIVLSAQDGFLGGLNGGNSGGGGGGSTPPGGANTSVQFNNAGAFGGFGTWNGSLLTINNVSATGNNLVSQSNGIDEFFVRADGFVGVQQLDSATNIHAGAFQLAPGGQYLFSDGVDYGAGLSRPGGAVLKTTDGGSGYSEHQAQDFKLVPNGASQPTCVAGIRGTIWYTSSANGVPDKMEVCAKPTTDIYAWIAMAVIP